MARPRGAKNKKTNHVFKDPQVEEVVEVEVEFMCPKRGLVKQKVKMKKLKAVASDPHRVFVGAKDIIDDLESKEEDISSSEPDPEE
jgi:ribosomal protein L13